MSRAVYTVSEVAKICKWIPNDIYRWFDRGDLEGYLIPGTDQRRIPRGSLIKFIKRMGFDMPEELARHNNSLGTLGEVKVSEVKENLFFDDINGEEGWIASTENGVSFAAWSCEDDGGVLNLSRQQVMALTNHLQAWLSTGSLKVESEGEATDSIVVDCVPFRWEDGYFMVGEACIFSPPYAFNKEEMKQIIEWATKKMEGK